ncbi:NucA/NucB deoxyribonuclease domain-containing protein [Amycolatopsis japonica]|uniref:NucA/NucB deoxyribonuclease domain-containing protein n=1 Tax=Amycolatopsis japonica TaxID=208439 RepID=UPI0038061E0F
MLVATFFTAEAANADSAGFGVLKEIPLPPSGVSIDSTLNPATPHTNAVSLSKPTKPRLEPTEERAKLARQPVQRIYPVDSSKYASNSLMVHAGANDPITSYECQLAYENGYREEFFVKNRFAHCQYILLTYTYYERLGAPPSGTATAKATIVFNMQPNTREIQVATRLFSWSFSGYVPLNRQIGAQVGCMGIGLAGSTAKCNYPEQGSYRSISSWQTSPVDAWSFLPQGEDPPNPDEPDQVKPEKRTLYNIARYFYTYGGPGPWDNFNQTPTSTLPFRCDVARATNPNYAKSSDCVFHGATGWLRFNVNDPAITESAQLYFDAHQDFDKTYPSGGQGKYVPGNIGVPTWEHRTEPIRRNFYDSLLQNNNYNTSVKFCKEKWGPNYKTRPDGQVNECDEFPFKTTYEGSFTVTPNMLRTVAVRPVLKEHNRETGSRWGTFLAEDHILDGDRVFVEAYK